jgi:hypothetical protein
MSLLEQQNFLARVFTDENLRLSFWENPEIVGKENGLDDREIVQLKEIFADDLNYFADSLFHKRLHEVEKLLPLTKRVLDKDFAKLFRQFSRNFQSSSIKKHLEDAIEFCKYLQQLQPDNIKNTAKFEQTKHEFFSYQKRFSICFLRHDVFNQSGRFRLAVWYRIGNKTRHFIL